MLLLLLFQLISTPTQSIVVQSSRKEFQQAGSLTIAPDNSVIVIDQSSNLLVQFADDGVRLKKFGGQGWGNYEFDVPSDVTSSFLPDVFVVDRNNRRIQRFDKHFNYIQSYDERSLQQSVERFQPRSCALSSLGDLFVIEHDGKRILKLSQRGQLYLEFGTYKDGAGALVEPNDIAVSPNDEIFVLDHKTIKLFDVFGNHIRSIRLPDNEQWKNIQVNDTMVIVTSSRSINLYLFDGSFVRAITASSIVEFDDKEEFQDAAMITGSMYILTSTTLYRCFLPP